MQILEKTKYYKFYSRLDGHYGVEQHQIHRKKKCWHEPSEARQIYSTQGDKKRRRKARVALKKRQPRPLSRHRPFRPHETGQQKPGRQSELGGRAACHRPVYLSTSMTSAAGHTQTSTQMSPASVFAQDYLSTNNERC